jgi:hypothetical protein
MIPNGTRVNRWLMLAALVTLATACEGPTAADVDTMTLSLTPTDGRVFWLPNGSQESVAINGDVEAGLNDQIWTAQDQGGTLKLADGSLIQMGPGSNFFVRRPHLSDARPILRLVSGEIGVIAESDGFVYELYRELPVTLRIVRVNMTLEPTGTPGEFALWFDGDTGRALVNQGAVDVSAGNIRGTLLADWQAELVPDQPLRILPPTTPTPTPSRTPIASPTSPATVTHTPTKTATATNTFIPRTAIPTAAILPTNTPGESKPKPTQTPTNPPPPTSTPAPTNTPLPTDTPTSRPTATPVSPTPPTVVSPSP